MICYFLPDPFRKKEMTVLSVKINDPEKLTGLLFEEEAFDRFTVLSALVQTDLTLSADARTAGDTARKAVPWKNVRASFSSLIRSTGELKSFRLVLLTPDGSTRYLQEQSGFTDCAVSSFSMNFTKKEDGTVMVSAGVSYLGFSLDKSAEKYWDSQVEAFLKSRGIGFAAFENV